MPSNPYLKNLLKKSRAGIQNELDRLALVIRNLKLSGSGTDSSTSLSRPLKGFRGSRATRKSI